MSLIMSEDIGTARVRLLGIQVLANVINLFILLFHSNFFNLSLQFVLVLFLFADSHIGKLIKRREEKIEREKEERNLHAMICPVCQHWVYYNEKEKRLE